MKAIFLLFFVTLLLPSRLASAEECDVNLKDPDNVHDYLEESLRVNCTATMMEITISSCVFEAMGYNSSNDLVLNGPYGAHEGSGFDPGCMGIWNEDDNTVTFVTGLDDCDTHVVTGEAYRVYYNAIRTIYFSNIMDCVVAFRTDIEVNVSCEYAYYLNDTVGPFYPDIVPLNDVSATGMGEYGETVMLCHDSDCEEEIEMYDSVNVLDLVFVVIHVDLESLVVQIVNMWATPTEDAGDDLAYDFMFGGCPRRSIFDVDHYSTYWGWFCFPAFHWAHDSSAPIFIHIEYMLCDINASDDCDEEPECSRRKRRDVSRLTAEKRDVRTKTIGPLNVR